MYYSYPLSRDESVKLRSGIVKLIPLRLYSTRKDYHTNTLQPCNQASLQLHFLMIVLTKFSSIPFENQKMKPTIAITHISAAKACTCTEPHVLTIVSQLISYLQPNLTAIHLKWLICTNSHNLTRTKSYIIC